MNTQITLVQKNKKSAFIVDTPIQIYNAINIALQNRGVPADIYIVNQFINAEKISNELGELDVFNNVYLIPRFPDCSYFTFLLFTIPNIVMKLLTKVNIQKQRYTDVYFSCTTVTNDFFTGAARPERVHGMEDGLGSYIGDFLNWEVNKKYTAIREFMGVKYRISDLLLYLPQLHIGNISVPLVKIYCFDYNNKTDMGILKNVFSYKSNPHCSKVIFLEQPMGPEAEKQNVSMLSKIYDELNIKPLVRLHPRTLDIHNYTGFDYEQSKSLWEMECIDRVDNNTVLISSHSSAMFTPKMMYNKEPILIFTYKLYGNNVISKKDMADFQLFINKFIGICSNKNTIFIPESIEELMNVLSERIR